ncbi:CBS domain-containing protein [uncultured Maribacter sp.]|uniref:CBS domain-containing protein n=1 Tax=uncultured Maribacter sp. TaxID=431308 RepID=UPI0034212E1B
MAKNLVSVTSKTTIRELAQLLSKKEFHAIPVIDTGRLRGIATTTDLLNYMLEQF